MLKEAGAETCDVRGERHHQRGGQRQRGAAPSRMLKAKKTAPG